MTQSLEFAAIRFLEGYWGGSILAAAASSIGVQIQQVRLRLLDRRASKLERKAFKSAASMISENLQRANLDETLVSAILLFGCGQPTTHLKKEEKLLNKAQRYYAAQEWLDYAPAHLRHRLDSLYIKRKAFPADASRMMPTRLGNAMRSFEDDLRGRPAGEGCADTFTSGSTA